MLVDASFEAEWDALADRAGADPFHRPGWHAAWWAAFGRGTPRVHGVRRDGRLVAVLPTARRLGTVAGLHNWHTFTFGPVAEDEDATVEVLSRALATVRWSATLSHLLPGDVEAALGLMRERGDRCEVATVQRSPYITVEGTFEDYLARRDTRWIRQLEKRRATLAGLGDLRLDVHDGSPDPTRFLAEAFRIEALGWKGEAGTAIVSSRRTEEFYRSVAQWAAGHGLLRIAILRLGERGIAADIALQDARSHYFLKTGFDPQFRRLAPGLILRHDMIRRCFDDELSSYEMLGSAEPYKMRWTTTTRQISRVRMYPRSVAGTSARWGTRAASVAGRAAARAVRTARRLST